MESGENATVAVERAIGEQRVLIKISKEYVPTNGPLDGGVTGPISLSK